MPETEIRDRIHGAWVGQMIGVAWGFPTEFYARYIWQFHPEIHRVDGKFKNTYAQYEGGPIPLDKLPVWRPKMINGAYQQDDLYVEVPFMEALRRHGVNTSWSRLGEAFARSEFPLYHANHVARENLRVGIAPPLSGHYSKGGESDDIDWQIEADFVGLMNPGQLQSAADIAFRGGHVMNYGDGVYGGVFVATMVARAFTADTVREIVEAGRDAVPDDSLYRQVINQVIDLHDRGESFDRALASLYRQWGTKDRCVEWGGARDPLNIDAKLNGAFILMGLLYGDGDLEQSMRLAMACGQDSDCNPSNVGSVLGAFYGHDAIARLNSTWLSALDRSAVFETTEYTLDDLVTLNLELARAVVTFKGGEAPRKGTWRLPVTTPPEIVIFEQWPQSPNDSPRLEVTVTEEANRAVKVHASATDADGIAAYQWFFGDLTFASGPDHVHTYRMPGTYELIAYVSDQTGNSSCEVVQVVIR